MRRSPTLTRSTALDALLDEVAPTWSLLGQPERFPADYSPTTSALSIITTVRDGLGALPTLREELWLWGSGGAALRACAATPFEALRARVATRRGPNVEQIDRDVGRSGLSGAAEALEPLLRNVLIAYAMRNERVGYCQGMNFLAALCLKNGMSESTAFWVMAGIVEMPGRDYYGANLEGLLKRVKALELLLDSQLATVATVLRSFDTMPTQRGVLSQMLAGALTATLPADHLPRAWDLMLLFRGCAVASDVDIGLDDALALEFYAGLGNALETARNAGDADGAVMISVAALRRTDDAGVDALLCAALVRLAALRAPPRADVVRAAFLAADRHVAEEIEAHAASQHALRIEIAATKRATLTQLHAVAALLTATAGEVARAKRGDFGLLGRGGGARALVAEAEATTARVLAAVNAYRDGELRAASSSAAAVVAADVAFPASAASSGVCPEPQAEGEKESRSRSLSVRPPSESLRELFAQVRVVGLAKLRRDRHLPSDRPRPLGARTRASPRRPRTAHLLALLRFSLFFLSFQGESARGCLRRRAPLGSRCGSRGCHHGERGAAPRNARSCAPLE
jgi:hypothetical protein